MFFNTTPPIVWILMLPALISCSKPDKQNTITITKPLIQKTESFPIHDSQYPLPKYLSSRSGFYISSSNSHFISFKIAIKSISLIDLNGDSEHIIEFEKAKIIDLAALESNQLLVFDEDIFSSHYERMVIHFDVLESEFKPLNKDGSLTNVTIHNFIDFDFSAENYVVEVGINKGSLVTLRSDEPVHFFIRIDLDHSISLLGTNSSSIPVFNPSILVKTQNSFSDLVFIDSKGFTIHGEHLTINTHPDGEAYGYQMRDIDLSSATLVMKNANPIKREDVFSGNLSPRFLAVVSINESGHFLAHAFFVFTDQVSLDDVFNQVPFNETELPVALRDVIRFSELALLDEITPLLPSFYNHKDQLIFTQGQAGLLMVDASDPDVRKLMVFPNHLTTQVFDINNKNNPPHIFIKVLDNHLKVQKNAFQGEYTLSFLTEHAGIKTGNIYKAIFHALDKNEGEAAIYTVPKMKPNLESLILSQSMFNKRSLIESIETFSDHLSLRIASPVNAQGHIEGNEVIEEIILSDKVPDIRVSHLSNSGLISKQLVSYRDLLDELKQLESQGGLVQTIKLYFQGSLAHLAKVEVVLVVSPTFYDALAYINGEPLTYLSDHEFNHIDFSFIGFPINKETLLSKVPDWAMTIPYQSDKDKLACQTGNQYREPYYLYCQYQKFVHESRRLDNSTINKLFKHVSSAREIRSLYQQLLNNLPVNEKQMLEWHLQHYQGYYPPRIVKTTAITKAEKIIDNLQVIYGALSEVSKNWLIENKVKQNQSIETPQTRKR